jgi:peptide/nickel transport system substrate-binding protein
MSSQVSPSQRRVLGKHFGRGSAAVALIAALVSVSACATPVDTEPVAGGTLNWGIDGANLSDGHMDPHASQLDVSAYVNRATLDSLVYLSAEGELKPWLATQWQLSEDGKIYTFTLRDDVTFSDGVPFNAEAVKANFDHIMDPATQSAQASSMLGDDLYVATEVVDATTVIVRFAEPFAPFLTNASTTFLGMYSPSVLGEKAETLRAGGPDVSIGSGPFIMQEYIPNDIITYTRNPDYAWAPQGFTIGEKAIETLNIKIVPETTVRLSALTSGELDLATGLTPNVLETAPESITVTPVASPGLPYSLFLNQKNGVFADPLVREAFARGIDIQQAVEAVFFGQYDQAWSILSPTTPNSYDESLENELTFDQDAANALLDEAGWTQRNADGFRTKDGQVLQAEWYSWTPISEEHKNLASLFADNLKEIGFKLEHKVVEPAEYNERYGSGTYDLTDWDFASADANILRAHLHSTGFQNASLVADPELDALLDEAAGATDSTARAALYSQVQQWNADNLAILPIYTTAFIDAQAQTAQKIAYDLFGWPLFISAETSHTS